MTGGNWAGGNLGDLIRRDVDPDVNAVIDLSAGARRWSYRVLDRAVAHVGVALAAAGYRRGDRIAIMATNSAPYLAAYLGIMRAGMIVVPINHKLPRATIEGILDDCAAACVLVDDMEQPPGWPKLELSSIMLAANVGDVPSAVVPDGAEIAQILYTSGSTGRPKGVPLSHGGQRWALSIHRTPTPARDETALIVAPMFHMNALFNLSHALINGVRIVLMPRFVPKDWLSAIETYRCTTLSGVPAMFAMAVREQESGPGFDLSSVRAITIASAPLTGALVERVGRVFPNAVVRNGYGTTEAGPSIFGDHPDGRPRPSLSVGYPIAAIGCRLVNETIVGGTLELHTPANFAGYLNLPGVTEERLNDGWYTTGDIMRRDADGFFYFVGRADDMFVCGGENLYPGEIEKLVERHTAVAQAAVVAIPDEIKGAIPIAFVVTQPGITVSSEDLKAFTLAEGPAYAHPRAVVIVDALPLNGAHKLDRAALLSQALDVGANLERAT